MRSFTATPATLFCTSFFACGVALDFLKINFNCFVDVEDLFLHCATCLYKWVVPVL